MLRIEVTGNIYFSPNIHIAVPGIVNFSDDGELVTIGGDLLIADSPEALSALAEPHPVLELNNEEE